MRSRRPYSFEYPVKDTANTTRIMGSNAISFNIHVTQMIYPMPEVEWRPNAVILIPLTSYHYAMIASSLVCFPINAPLLFTYPNGLHPDTLQEIERLSPSGGEAPAQAIMVGPIAETVQKQLESTGYTVRHIEGGDPFTAAAEVLEFRNAFPPRSMAGNENIILMAADSPDVCLHTAYYAAHSGVPILFTLKDRLPDVTRNMLLKYNNRNVFLVANERMISNGVMEEVKQLTYGMVDRIGGSTLADCAVNFAKYRSVVGRFGWDMNRTDGWAFCFGTEYDWAEVLAACVFALLGKNAPFLFIEPSGIPDITFNYVLSLKPHAVCPPRPPYMHGYILGEFEKITRQTQVEIERLMNIRTAEGEGVPTVPIYDPNMVTFRNLWLGE